MEIFANAYDVAVLIQTGMPVVAGLTLLAFVPALVLGIIGGLFGNSSIRLLSLTSVIYVYLFRSVPFIMLIFIVYYGFPRYGINIDAFATAVIALCLCHGAYMTEIIRGGLKAFDKGQNEAAIALGFSFRQQLQDIVLPQTLMAVVPSLLGQTILMVKDTSVVSIIGISELTRIGREVVNRTNEPFLVFTIVAASYYVFCFFLELIARYLEVRARRITSRQ